MNILVDQKETWSLNFACIKLKNAISSYFILLSRLSLNIIDPKIGGHINFPIWSKILRELFVIQTLSKSLECLQYPEPLKGLTIGRGLQLQVAFTWGTGFALKIWTGDIEQVYPVVFPWKMVSKTILSSSFAHFAEVYAKLPRSISMTCLLCETVIHRNFTVR